MNELDEIRRTLEEYTLDSYNINNGWNKLQQRKGGGRYRLVRMIAGAAAACVIIGAGYWFLKEESDERKHHDVTVSGVQIHKEPKHIVGDSVVKSISGANESLGISALQKKPIHLANHRKEAAEINSALQDTNESAIKQQEQEHIGSTEESVERVPVAITQTETRNAKPLEVISEEKLLATVSAVVKTEPKQSKLKHFFISRGEQQEYTTEKYSSDLPMFQP